MINTYLLDFSMGIFQLFIATISFIVLLILSAFGIIKLCIWLLGKM